MILANQIMEALVGSGDQQLNYFAGVNSVLLPLGDPNRPRVYVLTPPDGEGRTLPAPEKAELSISGVDQAGNYQVDSAGEPRDAPRFQRQSAGAADGACPAEREGSRRRLRPLQAAGRAKHGADRPQRHDARVGREIFSWLIIAFAGLLAIEYIVSNWFYKPE